MATSNSIIRPHPGPQRRFIACNAFEVLYGGAVAGGKSFALLLDALGQVNKPRYRALILRKTFPELRELMQRARELYPTLFPGARYNQTEKVWTFPSGARIEFGYLQTENDLTRYQGQEYTYLGIDELTHFDFYAYEYLKSRVRTPDPDLTCYVRATCNPGGKGHAWVRARFVEPAPPESPIADPLTGQVRVFIPALLKDNPSLANTDYGRRLLSLPEAERKALLEGDWYAYEGAVFKLLPGVHTWTRAEFAEYVQTLGYTPEQVDKAGVPKDWKVFRCFDWGFAKPFACVWFAMDFEGRAYGVLEYYGVKYDGLGQLLPDTGVRLEPEKVASKIAEIERAMGWEGRVVGVADPACWAKGRGDQDAGPSIVEKMSAHKVYFDRGKNDRLAGWTEFHHRLSYELDEAGNVADMPGMMFIADSCPHTLRTLPALEPDEHVPEDVDTDSEDHLADAIRYFVMMRPWRPTKKKEGYRWLKGKRGKSRSAYVA